ncbi:serine/threonine-protein kinase [Catenulispora subtropica]|uniref:non-specific serine/threonine protein kinase n=1 Tax=Catenulispora subtropica TaxID=450798 RepID=A0ABP5C962_9ACTN
MSGEVDTERLAPGERVVAGRYVLRGELGRGGMGVVWRGEDRVIGRPVAVKEMRLGEGVTAAERAEFEQRILREARTAGRLNDPAVVTVFDVVHDNGSIYIVMELVEAPTLSDVVRRSGPLPPAAVAELGRQVLTALEAAHAAGIVHRDVKPSNIMLGGNGRAKLTDFGIAQAADDPTLTKTGAVIGSPAYLAPERLAGQEASPASDIWSLGAVLYFAIEGRAAFERDTTAATLGAVLNHVPYLTRVQGPLAAAVSGMLAAAPEGRLAGPQIRSLLGAVGSDGTQLLPPQQTGYHGDTALIPAGGDPTQLSEINQAPVRPRRGWLRPVIAAGLTLTALAVSGFLFRSQGYDAGKKHQAAADAQPSDAVQVYTVGGPHAQFPTLGFSGYDKCLSGPPFSPGQPAYQGVECSKPHDLEMYYATQMVDTDFSKYGTDGTGPIPYPGAAELTKVAQRLCWADRLIEPSANPAGSHYVYAALIPSEDLWNGAPELPKDWKADRTLRCVMWNTPGQQLPGDVSQ